MSESIFTPTYLMIKRHRSTGLMYFCKTSASDPLKYHGSGVYWKKHLKIHGRHVDTIWHQLFHDKDDLMEFALFFSELHDVVGATLNGKKVWANEVPEDGLGGGYKPRRQKETEEEKISRAAAISKGKKGRSNGREGYQHRAETIAEIKNQKGWKHTDEAKQKMRKPKGPMADETKEMHRSITASGWAKRREKYGPTGRTQRRNT